jgi:O-antigen ligase
VTAIGIRFQQSALALLVPLMAVIFWSRVGDPVNVPRSTFAAVVAILVVVLGAIRTAATRRLVLPAAPVAWAAAAMGAALVVATVTSDVPGASVAGTLGRSDGLILYGTCVALFLVGLRVLDAPSVRLLAWGLLAGGAFAVLYGVLQQLDLDPINWADVGISPVIGTFGNPDFESGYLGIVVPAAGWGAISRAWGVPWRAASGCLVVACFAVAELSRSHQGLLAGGAGLFVLLVAYLHERGGEGAKTALLALAAMAFVVVGLVLAGLVAGVGPGQRVVSAGSLQARRWYWRAAIDMWRHHPVSGVGLDRFGAHYRSVRPAAAVDVNNYSDAAHSVPLHLLATGGVLVALPYVAVVGFVAWSLLQGLRQRQGEQRLLLGGVGGAWTAYQVQSLVSIDQPGLAVTHWLLAAAVVASAGPTRHYVRLLPGAVQPRARKGRAAAVESRPPLVWSPATLTACAVVIALGLIASWCVLKPLRASYEIRGAALSLARGDGNAALDHFDSGTRLAPYQAEYWLQRGKFLEQVKQPKLAASSYVQGLRQDPRAWDLLIAAAALAKAQNDTEAVTRYTRQLARVDPGGTWRADVGG